jgi:hypothetical protein
MSTPSDPYNTPGDNDRSDLPSFQPGAADNWPPMPGAKPEPPSSILNAVKLMFVGAGLSALGVIVALFTIDSTREQIVEDNPEFTSGEIDTAVNVGIAIAVIIGLIGVGLWIWMALTNQRGLSWARIVATVLGGLNVLFSLIGLISTSGLAIVLSVVNIALAGSIIWLLFRQESSQFYEAVSASKRT